jgi:hypothetical protein
MAQTASSETTQQTLSAAVTPCRRGVAIIIAVIAIDVDGTRKRTDLTTNQEQHLRNQEWAMYTYEVRSVDAPVSHDVHRPARAPSTARTAASHAF